MFLHCKKLNFDNVLIYTWHLLHFCPSWERDPSHVALSEVSTFFLPVKRFFFSSFSLLLLRVKGRGCHTLLKPYETNCGLWIWAIQIKFDWLIDIQLQYNRCDHSLWSCGQWPAAFWVLVNHIVKTDSTPITPHWPVTFSTGVTAGRWTNCPQTDIHLRQSVAAHTYLQLRPINVRLPLQVPARVSARPHGARLPTDVRGIDPPPFP